MFTVDESLGEPPILSLVEDFTDTIQEVESADDNQGNSNYTVGRWQIITDNVCFGHNDDLM